MLSLQNLNRALNRQLDRHTTRMLGGGRRPPPPDYFALTCRAFEEVLKINNRLSPFMQEQKRMLEDWLWRQEVEAALRKVYGDPACNDIPSLAGASRPSAFESYSVPNDRKRARQLLKEEIALAKTQALIAALKSKIGKVR